MPGVVYSLILSRFAGRRVDERRRECDVRQRGLQAHVPVVADAEHVPHVHGVHGDLQSYVLLREEKRLPRVFFLCPYGDLFYDKDLG